MKLMMLVRPPNSLAHELRIFFRFWSGIRLSSQIEEIALNCIGAMNRN